MVLRKASKVMVGGHPEDHPMGVPKSGQRLLWRLRFKRIIPSSSLMLGSGCTSHRAMSRLF